MRGKKGKIEYQIIRGSEREYQRIRVSEGKQI